MKALDRMNKQDKGKLLCALFPAELENLQLTMITLCNDFIRKEATLRQDCQEQQFGETDFWYALVKNAQSRIDRENKIKIWFSENLFVGADGLFTLYCVQKYAITEECSDKMRLAIKLFFD